MRPLALALSATIALVSAAPAGACTLPGNLPALRAEMVRQVNAERGRAGLGPLAPVPELDAAAQGHACDNARRNTLSHSGSDGSSFSQRIRRTGHRFRAANENVAFGMRDPAATVQQWMASPPHRRNLLSGRMRAMGVGVAYGAGNRPFWVFVSTGG